MRRLFYFTGYRLKVLHWKGRTLTGSSSFEPTEFGLNQFRQYLLQTKNIPGKFLVDIIEEDFRNERIPHVGGNDRKAVVNRLIDRYYRASKDYCYSEVVDREKKGRKDDIVLLSAMTNPQLITPWLTVIEECEAQLSGIWSLPLVSKDLLKTIRASGGIVLLVSQQVGSNIRQTLFRNGKLMSSRQSIINQGKSKAASIGELAVPEVERTIDYLRAQNLVAVNEIIDLHILGSNEQLASLQQAFRSNEKQNVSIHSISDVHKKMGLTGASDKFANNIFSLLCLNQHLTTGHYGSRKLFNRYRMNLTAAALYAASLLALISSVLITEANISDALEYEKSISLLKTEEQSYKQIYTKKFEAFEEVFRNAGVMNSAVALAERIRANGATSPLDFLIVLSEILARDKTGNVQIDKIEWQAVNINEQKNQESSQANFTANLPVKHNALVTGRIDVPENNYRASIDHIQRIVGYLNNDERVESVVTLRMPVDLRPESKFSTESGFDAKRKWKNENTGVFSILITMKESGHVS